MVGGTLGSLGAIGGNIGGLVTIGGTLGSLGAIGGTIGVGIAGIAGKPLTGAGITGKGLVGIAGTGKGIAGEGVTAPPPLNSSHKEGRIIKPPIYLKLVISSANKVIKLTPGCKTVSKRATNSPIPTESNR
ncbi:MAG: hypothetical protein DDT41_01523 [candidate division WS2 bacterium]|nr:hypothetical protein [Candidatus Psychracetigena formicireducens]